MDKEGQGPDSKHDDTFAAIVEEQRGVQSKIEGSESHFFGADSINNINFIMRKGKYGEVDCYRVHFPGTPLREIHARGLDDQVVPFYIDSKEEAEAIFELTKKKAGEVEDVFELIEALQAYAEEVNG